MRLLKIIVWTMALVAFWASAEQGAFTKPPVLDARESAQENTTALPQNSWEKLKTMFAPKPSETLVESTRKGR